MNEDSTNEHDEMREQYDFSQGVRGKYYDRYREGTNVILLDPDVASVFKDQKQVNDILRALIPTVKPKAS